LWFGVVLSSLSDQLLNHLPEGKMPNQ
jgi:hypothetical protein